MIPLCSRNARPVKALVGRAQWGDHSATSFWEKRASLEGKRGVVWSIPRARRTRTVNLCSFDARSKR